MLSLYNYQRCKSNLSSFHSTLSLLSPSQVISFQTKSSSLIRFCIYCLCDSLAAYQLCYQHQCSAKPIPFLLTLFRDLSTAKSLSVLCGSFLIEISPPASQTKPYFYDQQSTISHSSSFVFSTTPFHILTQQKKSLTISRLLLICCSYC